MKRKIRMILMSMILFSLTACWEDKHFLVEDAGIFIDIEKTGLNTFRVYLFKEYQSRGRDFIDIEYGMSDMPTIQISIPKNDKNKLYILDRWHDVKQINCSTFDFVSLIPERVENGELICIEKMSRLDKVLAQMDSVRDSIPSTTIQLNSRLRDHSIWQNGIYKGIIQEESR